MSDANALVTPTPERSRHSEVELLEKPIADTFGRYGQPHRGLSVVDSLERKGVIDGDQAQAGRDFHALFRRAHLDQLRASDWLRVPGNGKEPEIPFSVERARIALCDTINRLGGQKSLAGSIAWHVLGEEQSLQQWAENHGTHHSEARGILRTVLETLATQKRRKAA